MANILTANVANHLFAKGAHVHQLLNKESLGNIQNTNNLVRLATTKALDEFDAAESRAIDKVLQLPKKE